MNLVQAAERRRLEEHDEKLKQPIEDFRRQLRTCSVPGCTTFISRRNNSGVCMACHKAHRSPRACPKCGRALDSRNRQGFCRWCPRLP